MCLCVALLKANRIFPKVLHKHLMISPLSAQISHSVKKRMMDCGTVVFGKHLYALAPHNPQIYACSRFICSHAHTYTDVYVYTRCRRSLICSRGANVGRSVCFGESLFVWVLAPRWAVIRGVSKQDCVSHDAENPPPQGPDPNSSTLWL